MTNSHRLLASFLLFAMASTTSAQKKPKTMTGSAAKPTDSIHLKVVPDLSKRVARFQRVEMPLQTTGLSDTERKLAEKLVEACRYLEDIYWRQNDPDGLALYQSLEGSRSPRDLELRRYLWINASRFDLLDDNKPFVGKDPFYPGRGFYPPGVT